MTPPSLRLLRCDACAVPAGKVGGAPCRSAPTTAAPPCVTACARLRGAAAACKAGGAATARSRAVRTAARGTGGACRLARGSRCAVAIRGGVARRARSRCAPMAALATATARPSANASAQAASAASTARNAHAAPPAAFTASASPPPLACPLRTRPARLGACASALRAGPAGTVMRPSARSRAPSEASAWRRASASASTAGAAPRARPA